MTLRLTVTETVRGHKHKPRKILVVVGNAHVALTAGQRRTVEVGLNGTGKHLLATHHPLEVTLRVTQVLGNGHTVTVRTQTVTFQSHKPGRRHGRH